jgi:hypothetical protein
VFFFLGTQFMSSFFSCSYNNHQENIHVIAIIMQQLSYSQEFSTPQCKHVFKNKYAILIQYLYVWLFLYFTKLSWSKNLSHCSFRHTLLDFNHHATCIFSTTISFHVSCLFLVHTHPSRLRIPFIAKQSLRNPSCQGFHVQGELPTYYQASTANL